MHSLGVKALLVFIISIRKSLFVVLNLDSQFLINDFTLNISYFKTISFDVPTMKICLGRPQPQCFSLALSTTHIDTIIESTNSQMTFNNQFNKLASITFERIIPRISVGFVFFRNYDIFLNGIGAKDVFYLPFNSLSDEKLLFTLIENRDQTPKVNIDGILGLKLSKESDNSTYSFIDYLYMTNQIAKNNFALEYTSKGNRTIYLGETYLQNIGYCNLMNERTPFVYWNCGVTKIEFGNILIDSSDDKLEFNSLSSVIVSPYETGIDILNNIIMLSRSNCYYEIENDLLMLMCGNDTKVNSFPNLIISMGDADLVMRWSNLFRITDINGTMVYLSYFIVKTNPTDLIWSIGVPGFIDNFVIFDVEGKRLGIVNKNDFGKINMFNILALNIIIFLVGISLLFVIKKFLNK